MVFVQCGPRTRTCTRTESEAGETNEPDWYFGTDGNTPAGDFDFVTVVMHELAHGLGYAGTMSYDDGVGANGVECDGTAGRGCFGFGSRLHDRSRRWQIRLSERAGYLV